MLLALVAACSAAVAASGDVGQEERRVLPMDAKGVWLDLGTVGPEASLDLDLADVQVEIVPARAGRVEVLVAAIPGGADVSRLRFASPARARSWH